MAANKKQTSNGIASQASAALRDPNASAIQKSLAASALAQTGNKNQTSAEMEHKASMVLQSNKYNDTTKALAGSVLSQSNKQR